MNYKLKLFERAKKAWENTEKGFSNEVPYQVLLALIEDCGWKEEFFFWSEHPDIALVHETIERKLPNGDFICVETKGSEDPDDWDPGVWVNIRTSDGNKKYSLVEIDNSCTNPDILETRVYLGLSTFYEEFKRSKKDDYRRAI